jgi:hypothetical protein
MILSIYEKNVVRLLLETKLLFFTVHPIRAYSIMLFTRTCIIFRPAL